MASPLVHVYLDGLDASLCDELLALARVSPNLIDTPWRRCWQAPIDGAALARFKRALRPLAAKYCALSPTLNFCSMLEAPNVLGYDPDQGDKPHHFHEHADAWSVATATRQVSIIAYLNDVERGGETFFPGLAEIVRPRRGTVLMFPSNWGFSHLARAPKSGPKLVAVSWLHFGGEGHGVKVSPLESD